MGRVVSFNRQALATEWREACKSTEVKEGSHSRVQHKDDGVLDNRSSGEGFEKCLIFKRENW